MTDIYTRDELDDLGGAYYTALHQNDCSRPWEELKDFERFPHRQGAKALVAAKEHVERRRTHRLRVERRRTVLMERAG